MLSARAAIFRKKANKKGADWPLFQIEFGLLLIEVESY